MLIRTLFVFLVVLIEAPAAVGAGDVLDNAVDVDMSAVINCCERCVGVLDDSG